MFTGRVSVGSHAWVGDHAVMDVVLLPGTGFLELAFAAGRRVGAGVVEELTLARPFVLGEGSARQVQVVVSGVDEDGKRGLEIYSRQESTSDEEQGEWVLHATGVLAGENGTGDRGVWAMVRAVGVVFEGLGVEGWPPRGAEELDVEFLYDRLAEAGYGYGPAFQGLRRAWKTGEEMFCEVALDETQAAASTGFLMHPALLDASFHGALLKHSKARNWRRRARGEGLAGPQVPFSFAGVRLFAEGASRLRVRLSQDPRAPFALAAVDEHGTPVIAIERIQARPLDRAALAGASAGAVRDLYELAWTQLPSTGSAGAASADGSPRGVVVVGSDSAEARGRAGEL